MQNSQLYPEKISEVDLEITAVKISEETISQRNSESKQSGGLPIGSETPPRIDSGEILDWLQVKFGKHATEAILIINCESNGNPNAVNWNDAKITGMPSMGLFQLNRPYDEKYFDPILNISEAFLLYEKRGWQPWSCKKVL